MWAYLLILLAGTMHLRSRTAGYRLLGWLAVSALVYQGGLLLGLMGVAYRVNVPCVIIAIVIAAVGLADAWREGLTTVGGSRGTGSVVASATRQARDTMRFWADAGRRRRSPHARSDLTAGRRTRE